MWINSRKRTKITRWLQRRSPSRRDVLAALLGALLLYAGIRTIDHFRGNEVPLRPQTARTTISWLPPTVKHWEPIIDTMSARYDIDPNLIAIIMTMESGGNPKASSYAGAKGLMQVTAPTARDIAVKFVKQPVKTYNLEDPTTNIEFGTAYLAHLRNTFGDKTQSPSWNATVELIAAGYNGGPGAAASVAKGTGLRDMQTVSYARDAFNMWRERHAESSPTFLRWQDRGGSNLIRSAQEIK